MKVRSWYPGRFPRDWMYKWYRLPREEVYVTIRLSDTRLPPSLIDNKLNRISRIVGIIWIYALRLSPYWLVLLLMSKLSSPKTNPLIYCFHQEVGDQRLVYQTVTWGLSVGQVCTCVAIGSKRYSSNAGWQRKPQGKVIEQSEEMDAETFWTDHVQPKVPLVLRYDQDIFYHILL